MLSEGRLYERDGELVTVEHIVDDAIGEEPWERRIVTFRKIEPDPEDKYTPFQLSHLMWMTEATFRATYAYRKSTLPIDLYPILHQKIGREAAHMLASQIESLMQAAQEIKNNDPKIT